VTAQATGSWQPYGSSLVGVGLRQEVFDFGRIAAQSAVLDAAARAQGQRVQADTLNLDLAVRLAFFSVKASQAVLAAADAAYQRVKAHRDLAEAGVKSGLRAPIELTRADADLMRLDVGRVRARGALDTSRAVFAALVGLPQPQLDAVGDVPPVVPPPPLEQALSLALSREPSLLQAQALLEQQQAQSHAVLSELLPDLQLSSTLSGRAGGAGTAVPAANGWLPDVPNWDLGLVLGWQFGGTVLARHAASLQYEKAQVQQVESAKLQIQTSVEQAYVSLDVASRAVPALERSVGAARANYAQAEARFRAGLGTSVELADAESVRIDAEIQLALGQFDYVRARALLARAIAEAP
jgi:outer membrane protein